MSEHRILMKGRLGNQMFIYAFARALQLNNHVQPIIVDDWLLEKKHANRLDCFALPQDVSFGHGKGMTTLQRVVLFIAVKIIHNTNRAKRHEIEAKLAPLLSKFGIYYITDGYFPLPDRNQLDCKDFYMEGYFQSPRYFAEHRKIILKDFQFKPFVKDDCSPVAKMIAESNEPTCLHVRLGDYVNHFLHGVVCADYYRKALSILKEMKPDATIFLFSDNILLAKKELELSQDVVCLPEDYDDQHTMYLGSLCKNFIMSNSSLSWWMQYLSKYDDKIVIAPNKWYARDIPCDIYLDNWHLIDVDKLSPEKP